MYSMPACPLQCWYRHGELSETLYALCRRMDRLKEPLAAVRAGPGCICVPQGVTGQTNCSIYIWELDNSSEIAT